MKRAELVHDAAPVKPVTTFRNAVRTWVTMALFVGTGCQQMSEHIEDPAAGMNGGFEHARLGMPVNWLVYSPATVPTGSYRLLFDRADFREGEQSLRFLIEECSATGGWQSPGLCQEFPVEPGATYAISFWIKSEGCVWTVSVGGVAAKTGEYESVSSSEVGGSSWHHVERDFVVPSRYDTLRFELSITSPGSLWLDDVRIQPAVSRCAKPEQDDRNRTAGIATRPLATRGQGRSRVGTID